MRVLLCGASTRAAAESAARGGFAVTAVDAYADLDQHPSVAAMRVSSGSRATAAALARLARPVAADVVAYLSPFENHPAAVARLAAGRRLWGNDPDVLRRVRNPQLVAHALHQHGLPAPALLTEAAAPGRSAGDRRRDTHARGGAWLLKPLRSGGGGRVRPWRGGRFPPGCYLQERIDGTAGSVAFVAVAGRAVPLLVTRQLIGDANFGAGGYRYCGSITVPADDPHLGERRTLVARASAVAQALAAAFELVGLNGVDFVARDGALYAIEVNPRWSSSMELVEPVSGVSPFLAHAEACDAGGLPTLDVAAALARAPAMGKAIVYARHDVVMGDTRRWLDDPSVRDVPHPGEAFPAGAPVCTVLATAPDAARCYAALVSRAARVYAEIAALTGPGGLVESVRA